MKITKESLKKMVIQELTSGYLDYGGDETARMDFRTSNFKEDIERIMGLLEDMENIVRDDTRMLPKELQYLKTHYLDNLYRKIGFIEGAIDARLGGRFDEVE
tara:strand:- start:142 stop:447 length:306 start_codon:yes stop_codon:yes gene_type:complete